MNVKTQEIVTTIDYTPVHDSASWLQPKAYCDDAWSIIGPRSDQLFIKFPPDGKRCGQDAHFQTQWEVTWWIRAYSKLSECIRMIKGERGDKHCCHDNLPFKGSGGQDCPEGHNYFSGYCVSRWREVKLKVLCERHIQHRLPQHVLTYW